MLDRNQIAALDSQQLLASIEVLDKQCTEAWEATRQMTFPDSYRQIDRIVLFGMGGSALGIHFVKALFADALTVPVEIINGYQVPAFVNERTLAILSSYSGTTEEVLAASETILEKTKQVLVMTTGGPLQQFAEQHQLPAYIFEPQFNPSNQPRMAVGYSVMGTLGAFSALGLVTLDDAEVKAMASFLQGLHASLGADSPADSNPAKQLAQALHDSVPVLVSSEFLDGSTHVFTNQLNENSKQFADRFSIPELNHHLIEGLQFPRVALDRLHFVFITSNFYHERNRTRHQVTQEVLDRNHVAHSQLVLTGTSRFEQAFELLQHGSYVSLYLAILNGLDPSPIPNVDYLKEALKKS